jgi:hypothetical protein
LKVFSRQAIGSKILKPGKYGLGIFVLCKSQTEEEQPPCSLWQAGIPVKARSPTMIGDAAFFGGIAIRNSSFFYGYPSV